MNKMFSARSLAIAGLIAAMYAGLTLVLPVFSYGLVQCRLAEALTILAVLTPAAVPGLTIGCVVSNAIGLTMGANVAGAWDILLGSAATLLAALAARALRKRTVFGLPVWSALMPVIANGIIVGAELTLALYDFSWPMLLLNVSTVALGELLAATVGGLLLHAALTRTRAARVLFSSEHLR